MANTTTSHICCKLLLYDALADWKAACILPSNSFRYSACTRCAYDPEGSDSTNTSIFFLRAASIAVSPTCTRSSPSHWRNVKRKTFYNMPGS